MTKKSVSKYQSLVEGNLYKSILFLAVPTIITMLITAIYNAADTYFVSKFGESAIAGVSVVMSYMNIVQACGFFFGHGTGNYMSKVLGAKDDKEAGTVAVTGLLLSFAFGVLLMIISLIFIDQLVILFSNETMVEYTRKYFFYIILATPFMTASFTLNNQLRFQGNAVYGMVGMGVGAVLNIILDPILIEVTGGVEGASIATMICQVIGFAILFIGTFFGKNIRLRFKNIKFSKRLFAEIFKGGSPSLFRQGMMSIATIVMTLLIKPYGDFAIAGVSIAQKVAQIIFSVLLGFCQGFQPVCGFNYGAKRFDRVIKAFFFTALVATGYMVLASLICLLFADKLIGIFNSAENLSPENMQKAIELGERVLKYQAIAFPVSGFYVATNMMLQNIGKSVRASLLAVTRQGFAYIPLITVLEATKGLFGIEIAQPLSDVISILISLPFMISVLRELKREQVALENADKIVQ